MKIKVSHLLDLLASHALPCDDLEFTVKKDGIAHVAVPVGAERSWEFLSVIPNNPQHTLTIQLEI